jgi:hypothetical protein
LVSGQLYFCFIYGIIKKNNSFNFIKFMFKYISVFIILFAFVIPFQVSAFLDGPIVPCGRQGQPDCTLCHIFEMARNIITFIWELLIIIGPLFIAIGGFTILTGAAKPEQIKLGKKIISSAIIGIVIGFLAWTILGMVFNSLIGSGGLYWPWNEIRCTGGGVTENRFCNCGTNETLGIHQFDSGMECLRECQDYCDRNYPGERGCCSEDELIGGCGGEEDWCNRTTFYIWPIAGIRPEQMGDASPVLAELLNCFYSDSEMEKYPIVSISDDNLCNGTCTLSRTSCSSACQHACSSAHYGCGPNSQCYGYSYAVDIDIKDGDLEQETEVVSAMAKCIRSFGGYPSGIRCLGPSNESSGHYNHVHVGIAAAAGCGCDIVGVNQSCER